MPEKRELRLGGLLVRCDRRNCVFRGVHDPDLVVVIDDTDVPDLIAFLSEHSDAAKRQLRVEHITKAAE